MATAQDDQDDMAAYNRFKCEVQALRDLQPLPFCPSNRCTIEHIQGDLFTSHIRHKAHSVAADLLMSRGFAQKYVFRYGPVDRPHGPLFPGDIVSTLSPGSGQMPESTWLHVISKSFSSQKLRHNESAFIIGYVKAIQGLASYCARHQINTLATTAFGTGLDGLPLEWICLQMYRAFQHTQTKIVIHHFN
jgi:hypothetical protein